MTDSFVTQCPHCQTSFRVTHHQLSVARGVVRCGHCLQVFNAAKQLLEQNRALPASAPPVAAPIPAEPPLAPASEPVAEPRQDWTLTAQALDELDLDEELARLERRSEAADKPFGTATETADDEREEHGAEPMLVEQAPLELELDPAPGDRTEPTLGTAVDLDLDEDEPTHARERDVDRLDDDDEIHETGLSARDEDEPELKLSARDDDDVDVVAPLPMERLEPALAAKAERPSRKEPLVDVVDDPLQLGWEKPQPNWGKRLLWGLLSLLAAGLLAFQYVWFHFDEMARQDQYRPIFQQLCPVVGCQVPTRVDIARIKSSNLVVRSHPDFKGALIVDAIIYNRAPFAQPFPLLELRFADLNGQLIASRRFKPSEYLSGELAGRGDMPSQTPIHIALDILDPGPKAVNYSLSFRSPE
ncbi:DUF3426 domain-containing protein [Pseudomonas sp. S31]|uniref:DUF3426 domain-containing protein n=1 Tax=Pseudomonas sp. S31 TaxID=1564473 RepID=UPI0019130066|nr:DUF3426 domain-containing protein [Pseudomonas sp. S31]MBK4998658.1 DUF3426 domain-containing protein [Pseudomonas sp. S31]